MGLILRGWIKMHKINTDTNCSFCSESGDRLLIKSMFFTDRYNHLCERHFKELQYAKELYAKYRRLF